MNINNRIIINENMTMNQIIHITVFCLAVCLLSACGEKKITVKGADGTEYESYQECCAAQDFQAAHQFLAKMKNSIIEKESSSEKYQAEKMFNEAKEEVFKQEALFLMSQNNEEAQSRILYLLKEEGDNTDHIDMLVDLAIENDDEKFAKTLANQFSGSVAKERLVPLITYLSKKDPNGNKDFIITLLRNCNKQLLFEYALSANQKDIIKELAPSHIDLSNSNLMVKIASINDKQISDMIIGRLSEISISGECPKLGTIITDGTGPFESYQSSITYYNKQCKIIIDQAISAKNQYLAQQALKRVKSNVSLNSQWIDHRKIKYNVSQDNHDINEAKANI